MPKDAIILPYRFVGDHRDVARPGFLSRSATPLTWLTTKINKAGNDYDHALCWFSK